MTVSAKYIKANRKGRRTKVTSINIEFYQSRLLKEFDLDLSKLTRDFLDAYLSREFPDRFKALKEADCLELIDPNEVDED